MRILYVEDNPANISLLNRIARMGGHDVVNYTEGEQALENFQRDKPDLILMDLQLAGTLGGLDVVRKLRADGVKTPIVAVTAYAMMGDKERCLEAGCDSYMAKPLAVAELVELVQQYQILGDSKSASAAGSGVKETIEASPAAASAVPEKTTTESAAPAAKKEDAPAPAATEKSAAQTPAPASVELSKETAAQPTPSQNDTVGAGLTPSAATSPSTTSSAHPPPAAPAASDNAAEKAVSDSAAPAAKKEADPAPAVTEKSAAQTPAPASISAVTSGGKAAETDEAGVASANNDANHEPTLAQILTTPVANVSSTSAAPVPAVESFPAHDATQPDKKALLEEAAAMGKGDLFKKE